MDENHALLRNPHGRRQVWKGAAEQRGAQSLQRPGGQSQARQPGLHMGTQLTIFICGERGAF